MTHFPPDTVPRPSHADMLGPVLAATGIVVLLFTGYELVERHWLTGLGSAWTYRLHLARGLLSSLVAACVVAWLMHRASASLRATALSTSEWVQGTRPTGEERSIYYALWLIQLRWIAVVVSFGLVVYVTAVGRLSEEARWPIVVTLGVLALLNFAYTTLTRHRWLNRHLLPVQAYADLAILGILLHYSGGIENPLWIVLVFHVAIAGIVLERRQCYAVAAAAALLFAAVVVSEAFGLLNHHLLSIVPHVREEGALQHTVYARDYVLSMVVVLTATLLMVAYFVTTLGDRIRQDERQLAALANRAVADRELLERALVTTETGLCVLDPHLQPLWYNERWQAWFDDVPVDAIRRALAEPGERVTEVAVGAAPAGGTADDGAVYQLTTGTLSDGRDGHSQIVVLACDVTQQKRTQRKMVRAEKLAAVGELAGHVAHEVNNPIGIISAKTRLLLTNRRAEISDRVADEIAKITALADRVAEIAQGLLSYCRPSAAPPRCFDVRAPLREALALVRERAVHGGVTIEERLDGRLPEVRANPAEMQQVFLNLLLNSLDAMPRGGRIVVDAQSSPADHVTVGVADSGCGIAPEIRQSVREPFFTTKPVGQGTGLGLSVCDGVIRSCGGSLEIESEPGRGTRVAVVLPAAGREGARA